VVAYNCTAEKTHSHRLTARPLRLGNSELPDLFVLTELLDPNKAGRD
jgi:hypothetical protein